MEKRKYECPTRDMSTLEIGHGGHVLYIFKKIIYIKKLQITIQK
jgi:hypothetical protein